MYKLIFRLALFAMISLAPLGGATVHAQMLDLSGWASGNCTVSDASLTWTLDDFANKVAGGLEFSTHTLGTVNCTTGNTKINISSARGGLKQGEGVCGDASTTCVHYMATATATFGQSSIGAVVLAQGNGVSGISFGMTSSTDNGEIVLRLFPVQNPAFLLAGQFSDTIYVQIGANL